MLLRRRAVNSKGRELVYRGYVRLWRKVEDSEVWQDPNLWRIFETCVLAANRAPADVQVSGEAVRLEPGQFLTGRSSLRTRAFPREIPGLKIPHEATVWRNLLRLQELNAVRLDVRRLYTVVTIINWHAYQSSTNDDAQPRAQGRAQEGAPRFAHKQELTPTCLKHEGVLLVCAHGEAEAAHGDDPNPAGQEDQSISTNESEFPPDASRLLMRCDRHPLLGPFWDHCRKINSNLPRWFADDIEFAFQCGVTLEEAKKLAAEQPALLLNPRKMAERLIEKHTKRQGHSEDGPKYKYIKHNPDGSPDLSEWR